MLWVNLPDSWPLLPQGPLLPELRAGSQGGWHHTLPPLRLPESTHQPQRQQERGQPDGGRGRLPSSEPITGPLLPHTCTHRHMHRDTHAHTGTYAPTCPQTHVHTHRHAPCLWPRHRTEVSTGPCLPGPASSACTQAPIGHEAQPTPSSDPGGLLHPGRKCRQLPPHSEQRTENSRGCEEGRGSRKAWSTQGPPALPSDRPELPGLRWGLPAQVGVREGESGLCPQLRAALRSPHIQRRGPWAGREAGGTPPLPTRGSGPGAASGAAAWLGHPDLRPPLQDGKGLTGSPLRQEGPWTNTLL